MRQISSHLAILASFATLAAACGGGRAAMSPDSYQTAGAYDMEMAPGSEGYDHIEENIEQTVADSPLSTFSIDVDTASYANVRRFLTGGNLPPVDAVRVEELINYFNYDYEGPTGNVPFSVTTEQAAAPWAPEKRIVHIGVQGRRIAQDAQPPRNLVFLLDVSGSMSSANKLPLLKQAFTMLVDQLNERDRVSIVVYAGASGAVLEPTAGDDKEAIIDALRRLQAGGGTNGAAGIELAYQFAERNFDKGAINRVILATDGDFNVGISDRGSLIRLIEKKRKSGVFLTVLGLGTGNVKDSQMEQLADKGNGNYAYIDTLSEAKKVLVTELGATLLTIAKDVKIQVEFNPAKVASYRLIGYENRKLEARDFNDDTKDAGEIGAGHSVTAMYEHVMADAANKTAEVDALKYQDKTDLTAAANSSELMTVKLRYKAPDADKSELVSLTIHDEASELTETSNDFRFSAAVAGFGMLLRKSKFKGTLSFAGVKGMAAEALGKDKHGYRNEFLKLVDIAAQLSGESKGSSNTLAK
jgi:Ca-activated chloride channel family protein